MTKLFIISMSTNVLQAMVQKSPLSKVEKVEAKKELHSRRNLKLAKQFRKSLIKGLV